ncbi:MAG: LysR family transcriptional regulator [Candidatus Eisenbacteria bacterium]|nr:LysR family transcriptional regulator [Candidatus Eisenbacteria bacterium]
MAAAQNRSTRKRRTRRPIAASCAPPGKRRRSADASPPRRNRGSAPRAHADGTPAARPAAVLRMTLWIENAEGEVLFGEGRQQILDAIDREGSLSAAAQALGMSYRGLWARLRNSEKRLGFPLIESHAGRGPDSGTSLTPAGRELMRRFAALEGRIAEAACAAFDDLWSSA